MSTTNGRKPKKSNDTFKTALLRMRILGEFAAGEKLSPREINDTVHPLPQTEEEQEAGLPIKGDDTKLGIVAYHVRELLKLGYIKPAGTAQVRGAIAHFYVATKESHDILAQISETADDAWVSVAKGRDYNPADE